MDKLFLRLRCAASGALAYSFLASATETAKRLRRRLEIFRLLTYLLTSWFIVYFAVCRYTELLLNSAAAGQRRRRQPRFPSGYGGIPYQTACLIFALLCV